MMANSNTPLLKRSSAAFLQTVIVLVAIAALALLLWEPHLEGRNKHATPFEIYFKDPFLAYIYVSSIPFFTALFQAFKVLGYARRDNVISQAAVNAMRTIKLCAILFIGFVAGAILFIMFNGDDDRAGAVAMGILITLGSIIVATAAATFEGILQNAVDLKSENDLTV